MLLLGTKFSLPPCGVTHRNEDHPQTFDKPLPEEHFGPSMLPSETNFLAATSSYIHSRAPSIELLRSWTIRYSGLILQVSDQNYPFTTIAKSRDQSLCTHESENRLHSRPRELSAACLPACKVSLLHHSKEERLIVRTNKCLQYRFDKSNKALPANHQEGQLDKWSTIRLSRWRRKRSTRIWISSNSTWKYNRQLILGGMFNPKHEPSLAKTISVS